MKPLRASLAASLSVFAAIAAADPEARCTRVHPGPAFPREQVIDLDSAQLVVPLDGDEGLLILQRYSRLHPTPGTFLQVARPDGAGGFSEGPLTEVYTPGGYAAHLASRDLDGDGLLDALITWSGSYVSLILDFHKGLSDGTFSAPARWYAPIGVSFSWPGIGDFDADGLDEVAFNLREWWGIAILEPGPPGSWTTQLRFGPRGYDAAPAVVDWDGDGDDDLALIESKSSVSRLFIALGGPRYPLAGSERVWLPYEVNSLASLDGSLIVMDWRSNFFWQSLKRLEQLYRLNRYAAGVAWSLQDLDGAEAPHFGLDLDGDGLEDLVVRDGTGRQVHWGQAAGAPAPGPRFPRTDALVAAFDLDADEDVDLLTHHGAALYQGVPRQVDAGLHVTPVYEGFVDQPYTHLDVGDLNSDGLDDLVAETFYGDTLSACLSRGDGSFDVRDLGVAPYDLFYPRIVDADRDGRLDLIASRDGRSVAWGKGDGTFDMHLESAVRVYRAPANLDGQGSLDLVEVVREPFPSHACSIRTLLGAERTWQGTGFEEECSSCGACYWEGDPVDLDGDGDDDLVYLRRDPDQASISWRESTGDGHLLEERTLVEGLELGSSYASRMDVVDFDRDGTMDLFHAPGQAYGGVPVTYTSLRGLGNGRYETVWQGEPTSLKFGIEDRLEDVDADGRPDLVSGRYSPYLAPTPYVEIRRGDGLGGFLPKEDSLWRGPTGRTGVFRHTGTRDLVELQSIWFGIGSIYVELLPSAGYVLPEDVAPPISELRLLAAGEHMWRPAFLPLDECDSAPQRLGAVIGFPLLGEGILVSYEPAEAREILIFESSDGSRRGALLRGPSRTEMIELFNEFRAIGGTPVEYMQPIRLRIVEDSPSVMGGSLPSARLLQRIVIEGGRAIEAEAFGPDADLVFAMQASDRSGKIGRSQVGFREALEARAR